MCGGTNAGAERVTPPVEERKTKEGDGIGVLQLPVLGDGGSKGEASDVRLAWSIGEGERETAEFGHATSS